MWSCGAMSSFQSHPSPWKARMVHVIFTWWCGSLRVWPLCKEGCLKLRANVFVKDMQTFSFCLQPLVLTSPYYFSRLRPGLVYLVCESCDDTPCAVWPWWRRHWPNPAFGEGDESESQIKVLPVSSLSSVCTFQRMRKGQTQQKTATSARHSKTNQWNGVVISLDN